MEFITLRNFSVLLALGVGCFFLLVGIENTQWIALSSGERDYASGLMALCFAILSAAVIGIFCVLALRYLGLKEAYALYFSEVAFIIVSFLYTEAMMMA